MASEKVVLVTGATGQQGGATLRHLAKRGGFKLRAMTRNPGGDKAKALAALGAEVLQGDLDDADSLAKALAGAWGVFAVQNTWEAGVEKEEEQGKRIAAVAKDAGVQHFVYTSVGSAHEKTGIPHFENKFRVEQEIKRLGFPSHVILRPVFFMENLLPGGMLLHGDKLMTAMKPDTKLQMIAADDIGKFGAQAFAQAEKMKGAEIDIAGDAITMPEAAAGLSKITGSPVTFQALPIEAARQQSGDLAAMLEWFDRKGYSSDIASLEPKWGVRPVTFSEWVAQRVAAKG
jgi:uncharacterized protein YbjT (DUF2867 family)